MATPTDAIIFLTHAIDEEILNRFEKLAKEAPSPSDVHFALDVTGKGDANRMLRDRGIDPWCFTVGDIVKTPYPAPFADPSKKGIVPGNLDLLFLAFADEHPGYDRYWFIEFDVEFTGDWHAFFQAFRESQADLIGTDIRRFNDDPAWYWWPSLKTYPPLTKDAYRAGFFPIVRLSTALLEILDQVYIRGWAGHAETVMPTAAHWTDLEIEDIGGNGPYVRTTNRDRFYTTDTMRYRPVHHAAGNRPNTLYHPVKTPTSNRTKRTFVPSGIREPIVTTLNRLVPSE